MSDILIRGMEMPKNCGECFACKAELSPEKKVIYVCCFTREEYGFNGNRMDDCPLVPVPPHGRLKDYDRIIKEYDEWFSKTESREYENMFYALRIVINGSPTIIQTSKEVNK